jgi:hypothetical protein
LSQSSDSQPQPSEELDELLDKADKLEETPSQEVDYTKNPEALGQDIITLISRGEEGIRVLENWINQIKTQMGISRTEPEGASGFIRFPDRDAMTENEEYLEKVLNQIVAEIRSIRNTSTVQGTSTDALYETAEELLPKARELPGLEDLTLTQVVRALRKYPNAESPLLAVVKAYKSKILASRGRTPITGLPSRSEGKRVPFTSENLPRGGELAELLEENPALIPHVQKLIQEGAFKPKPKS